MDIDAIAFDALGTLFDLGDLKPRWKSTVVPWTWHATASGNFRPISEIVTAAGIDPGRVASLDAFPDVAPALDALRETPLCLLSNGSLDVSRQLVERNGLTGRFQHLLAAEQAGRYKPAPEAYALATDALGVAPDRLLLAAVHEWDVAGAKQAGLRTAWVARGEQPEWVLGIEADVVIDDLTGLPEALER